MTWRHLPLLLAVFILSVAIGAVLASIASAGSTEVITGTATVVDGDTLDVDGKRVRIYGIDAPEAGQKCNAVNSQTWPCGRAAINAMVELAEGKTLRCDVKLIDGYKRRVAACFDKKLDIGAELVRRGLAWAFIKYQTPYVPDQVAPKTERLGIWQADTETPWQYRAKRWEVEAQVSPKGCPIKGNISNRGRIYHAPWSPWYHRTRVSPEKGERWFCDEGEALRAGWRAPKLR